jgi:Membrane-associated lipoprotein involved in thiamine biosynthesis
MKRRRFLQISAVAALAGHPAQATSWQGQAFGAQIGIDIRGAKNIGHDLNEIQDEIEAIEATFSLHRPSELKELNARGRARPSAAMRDVLELARRIHHATEGSFDPTVQPLWQALADGRDGQAERMSIGFERVEIGEEIRLGQGQGLTLNGIVQGYAADRIRALLIARGYRDVLVDMGEFAAIGGPFTLGVSDPAAGMLARLVLTDGQAVATSSPGALALPGGSHILGPKGQRAIWSTVTVEAPSAALADAASTAFVLMDRKAISRSATKLGLSEVHLVDFEGNYGPL